MKTISLQLLTLCIAVNIAASQTVSTPIVGFSKEQLPAGQHFFSPSFLKASVYSGTATLSGATISGINISGSLGSSAYTDRPNFPTHYVEITSGDYAGTYYDIASNTSSSVTLTATPNVSGAVSIVIRPHVTLADVIKSESGIGEYSDSISVYDSTGNFSSYYFAGGIVTGDDFSTPMGHVPIPPGKGVGINTGVNLSLVTSGQVRSTTLKVPVYPGAVNVVGSFNPSTSTKLINTGLATELDPYSESATLYDASGNLALVAIAYSDGSNVTDDNFTQYTSLNSPSISTKTSMLVNVNSAKYVSLPSPINNP